MKLNYRAALLAFPLLSLIACKSDDDSTTVQNDEPTNLVTFEAHSNSPNFLKTTSEFSNVNIFL